MILIRKATRKDVPQIRELITTFFDKNLNNGDIVYDAGCAITLAETIIKEHLLLVLEEKGQIVGGIGGLIQQLPMSSITKAFQEVFFYIKPSCRGYSQRLLKELEDACKYLEVELIIMAHLSDRDHEKMDRFYFARGYKLLEKHYYRRI